MTTHPSMPIRVSDNGRYFVDANGAPWFWLGDTQWHLCRSFSADDARAIIENRKAKGFCALLVMLIGYESEPAVNINGDLPWIGDPGTPNERYYAHVDEVVRIARELGMLLVLGVYHKTQDRFYTPEIGRRSAKWIANRYRDVPNIVWSMYPEARLRYLPLVRAIAEGLREGDGGAHMLTVHPDPSPQSSSFLLDEPWLAFNMLQTCIDIELIHPMTASDYSLVPTRPAVMAEGGYEGLQFDRLNTPLDIRRQAYWTFLAGGHFVYGHNDHYQVVDRWQKWIDSPGSLHLAVYRKVVESLAGWCDVVPDQSIVYRGVGEGLDLVAAAHSRGGDWALVYFPSSRTATVRLDRIRTSETVVASWINPVDGLKVVAGEYPVDETVEFTTPAGWEDGLLFLEGA